MITPTFREHLAGTHWLISFRRIRPMAFARFRQGNHQVPPSARMIVYGLEAAQNLTPTLRDLRRTVKLLQSGLAILFPDETSGLQLLYSTLDRDLMQVERTCHFITLQLLTALAETHEDIIQLAAFSSPADTGVWINRLFSVPAGPGSLSEPAGWECDVTMSFHDSRSKRSTGTHFYPHSTTLGPSRVHAPSCWLGIGDPIPLPTSAVGGSYTRI